MKRASAWREITRQPSSDATALGPVPDDGEPAVVSSATAAGPTPPQPKSSGAFPAAAEARVQAAIRVEAGEHARIGRRTWEVAAREHDLVVRLEPDPPRDYTASGCGTSATPPLPNEPSSAPSGATRTTAKPSTPDVATMSCHRLNQRSGRGRRDQIGHAEVDGGHTGRAEGRIQRPGAGVPDDRQPPWPAGYDHLPILLDDSESSVGRRRPQARVATPPLPNDGSGEPPGCSGRR